MITISERSQYVSVSELFRSILRLYQNHFSLFLKLMIPILVLSLFIDILYYCGISYVFPNSSWEVSTSFGLTVYTDLTQSLNIQFSSIFFIFAWFALSMLVLTTYRIYRGNNVSFQEIWKQTYHRKGTIFCTGLLGFLGFFFFIIFMVVLSGLLGSIISIIGFFSILIYFGVRLSLVHQGIMVENLTAARTIQRSSELVSGKWLKVFGRLFLLTWISSLILNLTLAFTFFILSFVSTELVPIRESFLSGEIFTLFYGIPISFHFNDINVSVGNITMSLSQTPSFWIILVIDTVNTFVSALLIPLWAILTTHLYSEKTEGEEIRGETRADVMEAQI